MVAGLCNDPAIEVRLQQLHKYSEAMATFEGITAEVVSLRHDIGAILADQQAKIQVFQTVEGKIQAFQAVADAQAVIKIDTENRMMMQSNQQATLETKVSELITRLEKLEKSGAGLSYSAAGGKERWQLTRPKDMDPAEFTETEEE